MDRQLTILECADESGRTVSRERHGSGLSCGGPLAYNPAVREPSTRWLMAISQPTMLDMAQPGESALPGA